MTLGAWRRHCYLVIPSNQLYKSHAVPINSIFIKHSNYDTHQPHFHRQSTYCINPQRILPIMHFTNSFVLALATSVGLVSAALPKANEYKSNDW